MDIVSDGRNRNQDPLGRILQSYAGLASKSERYPGMLQCGYTPEAAPASSSLFCFLQIPCHSQLECIPCVNLGPHLLRVRWVQCTSYLQHPLLPNLPWIYLCPWWGWSSGDPTWRKVYIWFEDLPTPKFYQVWLGLLDFPFPSIEPPSNFYGFQLPVPSQSSLPGSGGLPPWKGVYFEAVPENCRAIRSTLDAGLPSLGF